MKRPFGFFLLAGFAAMLAALIVYSALKRREAEVQRAMVQSVNLVVAARDLPLGAKIDGSSVKLERWSRDSLPAGSYTDPSVIMGTVVKASFVENEPIVANKLYMGNEKAGIMPLLIPEGMRAMSVPVDEVSDIAGFVLPHAHVDILVALAGGGAAADKPISKVVLQNVEVLAVAQEIERQKDEPKVVHVVTVLVTLQEAERLALAGREGSLRLVLRNFNDNKIVLTRGSTVSEMLSAYSLAPLPVAEPARLPQQVRPAIRIASQPPGVEVDVLRNGRTAESLSFIDETSSHPRTITKPSPDARRNEDGARSGKVAARYRNERVAEARAEAASAPIAPAAPAFAKPEAAAFVPIPKVIDIP